MENALYMEPIYIVATGGADHSTLWSMLAGAAIGVLAMASLYWRDRRLAARMRDAVR